MDGRIDCALGRDYDVQPFKRWDERHLARLAAAHDGIVRLDELAALGLSREQRRRRIAQHRLIVMYRGVYAVGHGDVSERGRLRAAAWAAGDGAALSHLAAARLLGLWERSVGRPEVTVPLPRCPNVPGVRVHRATTLDIAHVRGIPCTTVARLLVDLAATPQLEAVFERAERKRWVRPEVIERLLRGRPGAAALRTLLETHRPTAGPTRSVLERRVLGAIRRARLPEPVVNGLLKLEDTIIQPDLMWPPAKVLARRRRGSRRRYQGRARGIAIPWPPSSPSSSRSP